MRTLFLIATLLFASGCAFFSPYRLSALPPVAEQLSSVKSGDWCVVELKQAGNSSTAETRIRYFGRLNQINGDSIALTNVTNVRFHDLTGITLPQKGQAVEFHDRPEELPDQTIRLDKIESVERLQTIHAKDLSVALDSAQSDQTSPQKMDVYVDGKIVDRYMIEYDDRPLATRMISKFSWRPSFHFLAGNKARTGCDTTGE